MESWHHSQQHSESPSHGTGSPGPLEPGSSISHFALQSSACPSPFQVSQGIHPEGTTTLSLRDQVPGVSSSSALTRRCLPDVSKCFILSDLKPDIKIKKSSGFDRIPIYYPLLPPSPKLGFGVSCNKNNFKVLPSNGEHARGGAMCYACKAEFPKHYGFTSICFLSCCCVLVQP